MVYVFNRNEYGDAMEILIDIFLKSGRSAVELALFVLLPVMVVMLSLMRLLNARGALGACQGIAVRKAGHGLIG